MRKRKFAEGGAAEAAEKDEFDKNGPRDSAEAGARIFSGTKRIVDKVDKDLGTGVGAAAGAIGALPLGAAGHVYRAATGRKSRTPDEMNELTREYQKGFAKGGRVESKEMMQKEIGFFKKKGAPKSMIKHEVAEKNSLKCGGKVKMASGGLVGGRGNGKAQRGLTKGKMC